MLFTVTLLLMLLYRLQHSDHSSALSTSKLKFHSDDCSSYVQLQRPVLTKNVVNYSRTFR